MASPGDLVGGRYRLGEPVGHGGMGTVWTATDVVLGREVALKEVVPPPGLDAAQQAVLRERTLREARAAARLSIASAVTVYDVVEEGGRPWVVMERLDAPTLADCIRENGALPPDDVARIGLALLEALQAAHASGVLHRDVKPSNVMLRESGPVLTDFGIAALEDDPTLTVTGMLVGSPAYMAPERARGHKATPASDLWSLGATLYAAVEGRSPFEREGQLATLHAVVSEDPPEPVHAGRLAPVLRALLAKDPAQRADAAEVRRMLQAAVSADAPEWRTPLLPAAGEFPPPGERTQAFEVGAGLLPAGASAAYDDWPADDDDQAGEGSPRRSRLTAALVALALAVLTGLVAVVIAAAGDDEPTLTANPTPTGSTTDNRPRDDRADDKPTRTKPKPQRTRTTQSPPTTPPTSTPPATTPPPATTTVTQGGGGGQGGGGQVAGVPAGFRLHEDPTGFSVAVPSSWQAEPSGSTYVDFHDPQTGGFLRIDQTNTPKPDPVADWEAQEANWMDIFPGYERIRIEAVDYRGWNAADAEFTYQGDNGTIHVLNRGFVTAPDQAYAIYWSMPGEAWSDRLDEFAVVASTFQPDE